MQKKLFSSSYLQSQCDEQSRITKQQIIDNGDESAEAFTSLFSFIRALLAQASVAHGFDFSALLDNTYLL